MTDIIDPFVRLSKIVDPFARGTVAPEAPVAPEEKKGFIGNMGTLLKGGAESALTYTRLADDLATGKLDKAAPELISKELKKQRTQVKPKEYTEVQESFQGPAQEWNEADKKEGLDQVTGKASAAGSAILNLGKQLVTNPKGVAYFGAEQAANIAPSLAGMYAGSKAGAAAGSLLTPATGGASVPVGAAVGAILGGFAGGVPIEGSSELVSLIGSKLQEKGLQPTEENIATLGSDPDFMKQVMSSARTKGVTTAGVDAVLNLLTGGIANAPRSAAMKAARAELGATADAAQIASRASEMLANRSLLSKAAHIGGTVGVETLGEGVSEGAGQYAAYGKIDPADVQAEMLGGLGASVAAIPVEAAAAKVPMGLRETPQPEVAPTPQPEVAPTPQPEVAPTPQPEVAPTPQPEVAPTPHPDAAPGTLKAAVNVAAATQATRLDSELESMDARVDGAMQAGLRAKRLALLDSAYADEKNKRPGMTFLESLEREFPNDSMPTVEEKRAILEREHARRAFREPARIPSLPDESGGMGVKPRVEAIAPVQSMADPIERVKRLVAEGNRINAAGTHVVDRYGKRMMPVPPDLAERLAEQRAVANNPVIPKSRRDAAQAKIDTILEVKPNAVPESSAASMGAHQSGDRSTRIEASEGVRQVEQGTQAAGTSEIGGATEGGVATEKWSDVDSETDTAMREGMLRRVATRSRDDADLNGVLDRLPDPLAREPYVGETANIAFSVMGNPSASLSTIERAKKIYEGATRSVPVAPATQPVSPKRASTNLVERIRQLGGISDEEAREIYGESKIGVPVGLVTKNGKALSTLAHDHLIPEGFPIDVENPGESVKDLLRSDEPVHNAYERERQLKLDERREARSRLVEKALTLGLKPGKKSIELLQKEIDAAVKKADAEAIEAFGMVKQELLAVLSNEDVDAVLDAVADSHGASPADFYRIATRVMKEKVDEVVQRSASETQEVDPGTAGASQDVAGEDPGARSDAPEFSLTGETEAEAATPKKEPAFIPPAEGFGLTQPVEPESIREAKGKAKTGDMFSGGVRRSVSPTEQVDNPHTIESLRAALPELRKMLSEGTVRIITAAQAEQVIGGPVTGQDKAFFNPADNTTYFIAEHIDQSTDLRGLAKHEIAVHAYQLGRSSAEFQDILRQVAAMKGPEIEAARAAVPTDTPSEYVAEETLGYLVQNSPELGIVKRTVAWFRKALRAVGWKAPLSVSDLLYMAHTAMSNGSVKPRAFTQAPVALVDGRVQVYGESLPKSFQIPDPETDTGKYNAAKQISKAERNIDRYAKLRACLG